VDDGEKIKDHEIVRSHIFQGRVGWGRKRGGWTINI